MVHTCTGEFAPGAPKLSDARARAAATGLHGVAPTGPCGATPEPPPLPSPPVRIEQPLATQKELMRVLTENLVHRGVRRPHH
jgi:hypothetical protein